MRGKKNFRVEYDSLGAVRVPIDVYYGAQTMRASENFKISSLSFPREFIRALGIIKYSAVKANTALRFINDQIGKAIQQASLEMIEGKYDENFIIDIFQTGSGTSTNMNANEVIANRACEIIGGRKGDKSLVHPNDHVNKGQSSNDVIPTAIHISSMEALENKLFPSLLNLQKRLKEKKRQFKDIFKVGRTHLQDAVPISLGQEFFGFEGFISSSIERLKVAERSLLELPIGGTAVGTGLNTTSKFVEKTIEEIVKLTGIKFRKASNYFEQLQGKSAAVEVSGALKELAVDLRKICNDLIILSSGPRAGIGEIELPAVQPGSSIMPGKVNPVIPEAVSMVSVQVIGNDLTIAFSGGAGLLELNTMMPLIAHNLLQSIEILSNGAITLAEKCIQGIEANKDWCQRILERSLSMITAVSPIIGYDKAAEITKKALREDKTIREVLFEMKILSEDEIDEILDPKRMIRRSR